MSGALPSDPNEPLAAWRAARRLELQRRFDERVAQDVTYLTGSEDPGYSGGVPSIHSSPYNSPGEFQFRPSRSSPGPTQLTNGVGSRGHSPAGGYERFFNIGETLDERPYDQLSMSERSELTRRRTTMDERPLTNGYGSEQEIDSPPGRRQRRALQHERSDRADAGLAAGRPLSRENVGMVSEDGYWEWNGDEWVVRAAWR